MYFLNSILVVAIGGAIGAVFRFGLTASLNNLSFKYNLIHWGTLLANLIGSFIAGVVLIWIIQKVQVAEELKLLIITGFCGALTTFSAFSTEIIGILQQGRLLTALFGIATHVFGSLLFALLGIMLAKSIL